MKTIKSILTTTLAVLTFATGALAAPGKNPETSPALKHESDFAALKVGDKVALVCKASDTVTVIDIKDQKEALALCKEGKMVECPDCKKEYKVTRGNPTGKGTPDRHEVVVVNEKGEPCMFFAKLK